MDGKKREKEGIEREIGLESDRYRARESRQRQRVVKFFIHIFFLLPLQNVFDVPI